MKLYNRTSDAVEVLLTGDGGTTTVAVIVPPGTHTILPGLSAVSLPFGLHVLEDTPTAVQPTVTKKKEPK